MQDRIVLDDQAIGFSNRDAPFVSVYDYIFFDRNIAVIHFRTSKATVNQVIAHENRLRVVPVADIELIAADHDVRTGRLGTVGPELYHISMIQ